MIITAITKIQVIQAMYPEHLSIRNTPMYNNMISINKNVTTTIGLEIKRPDRKAVILSPDTQYYLNVISDDGETYLIRKRFDVSEMSQGRLKITITAEDTDQMKEGKYTYSVTAISDTEQLLYLSDTYYGEFKVTDTAMAIMRPPFVQHKFTAIRTVKILDTDETIDHDRTQISSRLPVRKLDQSITLTLDNFTGRIQIQSTKDIDPNAQTSWENVTATDYAAITNDEVYNFTNIDPDIKYFRVKIIEFFENEGSVTKLEYR